MGGAGARYRQQSAYLPSGLVTHLLEGPVAEMRGEGVKWRPINGLASQSAQSTHPVGSDGP